MKTTHAKSVESKKYWAHLCSSKQLDALIFGRDPYPNDAIGIAFSKMEALPASSSGFKLLTALGHAEPSDASPETFQRLLDKHGVGVLNLSNDTLIDPKNRTSRKISPKDLLLANVERNMEIAKKSEIVIFLGKTICKTVYLQSEYRKILGRESTYILPHPAIRTHDWKDQWRQPGSLLTCIESGQLPVRFQASRVLRASS